jgi:hypothetical protein
LLARVPIRYECVDTIHGVADAHVPFQLPVYVPLTSYGKPWEIVLKQLSASDSSATEEWEMDSAAVTVHFRQICRMMGMAEICNCRELANDRFSKNFPGELEEGSIPA